MCVCVHVAYVLLFMSGYGYVDTPWGEWVCMYVSICVWYNGRNHWDEAANLHYYSKLYHLSFILLWVIDGTTVMSPLLSLSVEKQLHWMNNWLCQVESSTFAIQEDLRAFSFTTESCFTLIGAHQCAMYVVMCVFAHFHSSLQFSLPLQWALHSLHTLGQQAPSLCVHLTVRTPLVSDSVGQCGCGV